MNVRAVPTNTGREDIAISGNSEQGPDLRLLTMSETQMLFPEISRTVHATLARFLLGVSIVSTTDIAFTSNSFLRAYATNVTLSANGKIGAISGTTPTGTIATTGKYSHRNGGNISIVGNPTEISIASISMSGYGYDYGGNGGTLTM